MFGLIGTAAAPPIDVTNGFPPCSTPFSARSLERCRLSWKSPRHRLEALGKERNETVGTPTSLIFTPGALTRKASAGEFPELGSVRRENADGGPPMSGYLTTDARHRGQDELDFTKLVLWQCGVRGLRRICRSVPSSAQKIRSTSAMQWFACSESAATEQDSRRFPRSWCVHSTPGRWSIHPSGRRVDVRGDAAQRRRSSQQAAIFGPTDGGWTSRQIGQYVAPARAA